jgi:hypothetical protein
MTDTLSEDEMNTPAVSDTPKQWKLGKKILILIVLHLIGFGLWYLYQEFSQPAEGTVRVVSPKADLANPDLPPALVTHEKQYFKLTLSEKYEDKARETNAAPGTTLREQAYWSDPTGTLRKVAVTIDEAPGIIPSQLTSYTLRKTHPESYRETHIRWHDQEVVAFEKIDSVYEIVAYLPHEDRFMASVAIVSAYETPEQLIGDFSETLSLFEWTK